MRRWHGRDRGSATVEMVIMLPAAIGMMVAIAAYGKVALAQQAVDTAAFEAARTASISRTATEANTQGKAAATTSLRNQKITCLPSPATSIGTTGFAVRAGNNASVSARVICKANLSDIVDLPDVLVPNSVTLTASFTSPLDTYRSRT
jgi:Flp pilus assembly protein TadG